MADAEAAEAETLAKLRLEAINLEEEKLEECSERGSSVSKRSRSRLGFFKNYGYDFCDSRLVEIDPKLRLSLNADKVKFNVDPFVKYLGRQERNGYINLASQMGYDGSNLAFVFYENQMRRLMDESPNDERRLEVLRTSCIGQPREMINLFCAPMRGMTTAQRIEKAWSRSRQRYGVTGGLTSEPTVIAIRHGPKVSHTSASLKLFNEDLNTIEVFAYADGEYNRFTGQLLLDTANRMPNLLKRRYRDFVTPEIEMTTSQAFF